MLIATMPQGRERRYRSVADLEDAIAQLEHEHQTKSVSLSAEKKLLKKMRVMRASRSEIAEQVETQLVIDGLKWKQNELRDALTTANASLRELTNGLRKISAARQIFLSTGVDVPPGEIEQIEEVVENKHIPFILGATKDRLGGCFLLCFHILVSLNTPLI